MKLLKINDMIYENFELKTLVPVEFNENGNPTKFEERWIDPRLEDENFFKNCLQDTLIWLEFQRLQKVLDQYGYKDLGDVQYWHSQDPKDEEPAGLLTWYKAYDDAIWNEIDNLKNKTYEQLKEYDPVAVEQKIFNQTKDKLPPMED